MDLGRNYVSSNYQSYHRQMLDRNINKNKARANNKQRNNNSLQENNSDSFLIHPKGIRTKLSNSDTLTSDSSNNQELLIESPNPFHNENHPDFEADPFDNYTFSNSSEKLETESYNLIDNNQDINTQNINNQNSDTQNINTQHNNLDIENNNQYQLIPRDNQENNKNELIHLVQSWNDRLSWNNYFISIAFLIASRSTCSRLKVGCVLVKDTRVISVGYNGFLPKMPHQSIVRDNHEQATVHAEQNAVSDCARRGINVDGAIAYITHYPCLNCFKILAASGISEINYHSDYKNDNIVKMLSERSGININQI